MRVWGTPPILPCFTLSAYAELACNCAETILSVCCTVWHPTMHKTGDIMDYDSTSYTRIGWPGKIWYAQKSVLHVIKGLNEAYKSLLSSVFISLKVAREHLWRYQIGRLLMQAYYLAFFFFQTPKIIRHSEYIFLVQFSLVPILVLRILGSDIMWLDIVLGIRYSTLR